jgi:hypothetical protein
MLRKAKDTRGRAWPLAAFEAWPNELLLGAVGIKRKMAICDQALIRRKNLRSRKPCMLGSPSLKGNENNEKERETIIDSNRLLMGANLHSTKWRQFI